ncbi:hypothetical protein VCHENC02_5068, partial [Vibrio harveyi]
YCSGTIKFRNC